MLLTLENKAKYFQQSNGSKAIEVLNIDISVTCYPLRLYSDIKMSTLYSQNALLDAVTAILKKEVLS